MSAMDEFGLAGFLATVRSDNPDVAGLARGQDLTSLGLNLNSPEYDFHVPLGTHFAKLNTFSDLSIPHLQGPSPNQDQDQCNQILHYQNAIPSIMSTESRIRFPASQTRHCSGSSTRNRKISFKNLLLRSCKFDDSQKMFNLY